MERTESTSQAQDLAERVHAGQTDKLGVPYMEHVNEVARRVAHLGTTYEIAGLLHDALEDCNDRDLVSLEIITDLFGTDVADAVDAITKRAGEPYQDYLGRVARNPVARAVKLADLSHNMDRLPLLDAQTSTRLEQKYSAASAFLGAENPLEKLE